MSVLMDETRPEIKVDANTRRTSAGADWYPRRSIETDLVCWYYGPRLFRGVEMASPWCSADARRNQPMCMIPNSILSTNLTGGDPCPECNEKWSLT